MSAYAVRGLDINTSYTIYNLLNDEKKKGVAVIYVGEELDVLLDNLGKYRQALVDQNESEMKALLKEGRLIKEEVDKVDYRSR